MFQSVLMNCYISLISTHVANYKVHSFQELCLILNPDLEDTYTGFVLYLRKVDIYIYKENRLTDIYYFLKSTLFLLFGVLFT